MPKTAVQLWEEVLQRALKDVKDGPTEQEIQDYIYCTRKDAEEWLASDAEGPGTFVWVCDMLGLSPSAVRKKCLGGKDRGPNA